MDAAWAPLPLRLSDEVSGRVVDIGHLMYQMQMRPT
jgi:hypothetical protein